MDGDVVLVHFGASYMTCYVLWDNNKNPESEKRCIAIEITPTEKEKKERENKKIKMRERMMEEWKDICGLERVVQCDAMLNECV